MGVKHGLPNTDLISFVFENEAGGQDKAVLIDATDASRFITPGIGRALVRKLIAGLRTKGLQPGDCVSLHAYNDIYYPLIYLAIIGAGGRFTGSNPAYTDFELNHHVRTSHATFMISEPAMLATAYVTAKVCRIPDERVFVLDAFDKTHFDQYPYESWETLLHHGEDDWVKFKDPALDMSNTTAALAFTSWTTGLPKAAMISHQYSIAQIDALRSHRKPYEVRRLISLPAFHAIALPIITGCAIREQQSVFIMRRFELKPYLRYLQEYQISETIMVPTMLVAITTYPGISRENLQTLRYVWCGGSPCRASTQAEFQAILSPEAKVVQVWGMTETGWASTFFWPEGDDTGSAGRLLLGVNMMLKDLDGNVVDDDVVQGEMYVKGPCMMMGYLDNASATAATIDQEGWLRTGDVAYRRNGKLYIIDRAKDLIKVRGWQVAPAELEAILLTHPSISNAAVIGKPVSEGTGEVPRAYVQLKPKRMPDVDATSYGMASEKEVTEEEIKQYIQVRLARYKSLDGGVRFVEEIPRTASGKVQKAKLRAMDAEEAELLVFGAGENLEGVKAEDSTARLTEGEKFNECARDSLGSKEKKNRAKSSHNLNVFFRLWRWIGIQSI